MDGALSLQSNALAGSRMDGQIESLKAMSLGSNKKQSEKQMRETANQFEEIVIRQILKEMRKTVPKNGAIEQSHASEMYMEMADDHLAKQMADANAIGIGDIIYNELKEKNETAVDPKEARKKRDFINLKNGDGSESRMDYIPMPQDTETFMKLNEKRMMDLPQAKDPFMTFDRQRKVTTDRIEKR